MLTFSYFTQSKNPNIASEYEWEVLILIDTLLYWYFPSLTLIKPQNRKACLGSHQSTVKKKVHYAILTNKVMLFVLRCVRGSVYQHTVLCRMTINSLYYYKVLRTLKKQVNKKKPNRRKSWLLHHDNSKPHIASIVRKFLEKGKTEFLYMPHVQSQPCLMRFLSFRSLIMGIVQ